MATVADIKKEMTDAFIAEPAVRERYSLDGSKTFEEQFSKASIESIVFYIIAFAVWALQMLFGKHKLDVAADLDNRLAHRRQWYRDKVLKFQANRALMVDTDKYDNTGLSDTEIAERQTVKFCSVQEKESKILIKVAKGEIGSRSVLTAVEQQGLQAYINEIKDAGVLLEIVNQQADKYRSQWEIFYNPMLLNPSEKPIEKAIKNYVSNLDFNGEYRNMSLVDHLQAIEGVEIPHLIKAETKRAANEWTMCEIRTIAESGYFIVENDSDLQIKYTAYEQ